VDPGYPDLVRIPGSRLLAGTEARPTGFRILVSSKQ
jgi:hypothetical protein